MTSRNKLDSLTIDEPVVQARSRIVVRLCHDLFRYEQGLGPTRVELAAAPLLHDWRQAHRSGLALEGHIAGRSGPTLTSEVIVLDAQAGYCRTFSRLYRLGRRHSS